MPSVSLIIATYNRGPRIASTLDSVLAQTRLPDEIIVVDDCSPDQTGAWVSAHYPSVRVVRPLANGGTSAARNFGAKTANGDILCFLDHDDLLHPHAIETLLQLLTTFPEARAAFADHVYDNRTTGERFPDHHQAQPAFHRLRRVRVLRQAEDARLYGRELYYALLRGNLLQQPWAIRRDTFLKLGGFAEDIRYCEDWDLYTRIVARHPIVLSDRVISDHIIEGANLHLAAGQDLMHERVLLRRWRETPWYDWRATLILRQKLGMLHKCRADGLAKTQRRAAWREDVRSAAFWPFDYVSTVRAICGCVGFRPGGGS